MAPELAPVTADPVRTGLLLGLTLAPVALGVSTTAIALPDISADLGLSTPQAAWLLAAYLLAQAMCVSIFGRLADVRGLRFSLTCGGVMLALGSIVAATSSAFAPIVLGRLLQGVGAGALTVSMFGMVSALFAPSARPRVLGVMTAVLGIVSGSGTLIGGLLTDAVSWRAVIALPALALICLPFCLRAAPATAAGGGRLDPIGAALVAAAAAVAILLLESPSMDYDTGVLLALAVAGIALAIAVPARVRAVPNGFVPRELARDPVFLLSALAGLTIFAGYVATLFAIPLLLTAAHDWSATQIGLTLLPAAAFGAGGAWIVGRLGPGRDSFRIAALLSGGAAIGLLAAGTGDGAVVPSVVGLALALAGVTGANVSLVAKVPMMADARVRSVATGLFTLIFQVGGALGTAMVAGLADPIGTGAALATVAALPAIGVALALEAGRRRPHDTRAERVVVSSAAS